MFRDLIRLKKYDFNLDLGLLKNRAIKNDDGTQKQDEEELLEFIWNYLPGVEIERSMEENKYKFIFNNKSAIALQKISIS